MKATLPLILALTLVAGCTGNKNDFDFDGQYFRTKVRKVDRQRDVITVQVRDVSKSLEGARQAALHGANSYCVATFGSSDIDWVVGPDTPVDQLRIVNNTLTYQGTCPQGQ